MLDDLNSIVSIAEYIKKEGVLLVLLVIAIFTAAYLICNPDKAFKWKAAIQSLFVQVSKSARKGAIANRIRSDIISSTKKLGLQAFSPGDMKIEWVKEETPTSFFEGNQIIVRMSNQNHPQKNLVAAVCTYVKDGSLTKAKRYLTQRAVIACNYVLIRKILLNSDTSALDYYDNHIQPLSQIRDREVLLLIQDLSFADKRGMFIPVFLNELKKLTDYIYPAPLTDDLTSSLKSFLIFLLSATRGASGSATQRTELTYRKGPFRINIAFVANEDTLLNRGEEFYIGKIKSAFETGRCKTEYLFAIGQKISIAKKVAVQAKKDLGFVKVTVRNYQHIFDDGHRKGAVCIEIDRIED